MAGQADRILHGLYYVRENIDEALTYSPNQIWWLATHGIRAGSGWQADGFTRTTDPTEQMGETHFTRITMEQERPLKTLVAEGLISYHTTDLVIASGSRNGGVGLHISVTNMGRKRAIRLHTLSGRIGLWYEERKGGALFTAVAGVGAALGTLFYFVVNHYWK